MANDLTHLPWQKGQLIQVENYWEAAGVIAALRSGIAPESVRRPFGYSKVSTFKAQHEAPKNADVESVVLETENE